MMYFATSVFLATSHQSYTVSIFAGTAMKTGVIQGLTRINKI